MLKGHVFVLFSFMKITVTDAETLPNRSNKSFLFNRRDMVGNQVNISFVAFLYRAYFAGVLPCYLLWTLPKQTTVAKSSEHLFDCQVLFFLTLSIVILN